MSKLNTEFKTLISNIEINSRKIDFTIKAHTKVREVLNKSDQLQKWGLNDVLIGSYARKTGIYPGKDVDIFAKLENLNTTYSPKLIHDTIFNILQKEFGNRSSKQTRSVKISFNYPDDLIEFSVDIVPAVKYSDIWAIPSMDTEIWESGEEGEIWVKTNPEKLTKLTQQINSTNLLNGQGAYVPCVKMIKQIRANKLKDAKPGGLFFELMTYWAFQKGIVGESFEEIITNTISNIKQQLEASNPIIDPVLDTPFNPQPDYTTRSLFITTFNELEEKSKKALKDDICPAGVIWREIFGSNDKGVCFPIPEGCDEFGKKLAPIVAVSSKGSEEADGFADK